MGQVAFLGDAYWPFGNVVGHSRAINTVWINLHVVFKGSHQFETIFSTLLSMFAYKPLLCKFSTL